MTTEAHIAIAPAGLDAGVWPKAIPNVGPNHFQIIGVNRRNLVVCDLGGVISVGGVEVTDPDHLDEFAARIAHLATVYRERTAA